MVRGRKAIRVRVALSGLVLALLPVLPIVVGSVAVGESTRQIRAVFAAPAPPGGDGDEDRVTFEVVPASPTVAPTQPTVAPTQPTPEPTQPTVGPTPQPAPTPSGQLPVTGGGETNVTLAGWLLAIGGLAVLVGVVMATHRRRRRA